MPLKPTTQAWQSNLGQNIADLLTSWRPEQEDRQSIVSDWSQLIAAPAMQTWNRYVAPFLREGMNIPGAISRSSSESLARSSEQFFTGNVLPTLFSSIEASKNRELQWQGLWGDIFKTGAGLSTAQTLQYASKPSWRQEFETLSSGIGTLTGSAAGAGGLFGSGGMFAVA